MEKISILKSIIIRALQFRKNDFCKKKSLEYYTSNFSPISTTGSNYGISKNTGSFAQSYANSFSEAIGFIAADDANKDAVDYPLQ
jgi:hypothetical protein